MFTKTINRIKEAFMVSGYSRTAKELLKLSDAQLKDIGVSRELLKTGYSGYPWRKEAEAAIIPNNVTQLKNARVIANSPIMPPRPKAA